MFEKDKYNNEFDLLVKSILDEGQEEVPAHVWEAVSEGLDKAAGRKTVVIWFRRAAVSVAAAAAVAIAVIFNISPEADPIPATVENGLIAVVEPEDDSHNGYGIAEPLIALNEPAVTPVSKAVTMIPQTASEAIESSDIAQVTTLETTDSQTVEKNIRTVQPESRGTENKTPAEYFPEDWGEEEKVEKRDISLILSGIASTNSTQSKNRIGPMKAPSITYAPRHTGITETSTNSNYGLPLSFGAGVKIGISPRWSIGTGLNYTLLSRQFYGKYVRVDQRGKITESTSSDIYNTQHFIGIPVNAYYDIVNQERLNLYAYAGGTVEKCVSDNYKVINTSIYHKDKVDGVQISANVGIGVEFMLGRHLGLYIDPSVRYYFNCDQPKSIRTVQPLMLGFELGLRARL